MSLSMTQYIETAPQNIAIKMTIKLNQQLQDKLNFISSIKAHVCMFLWKSLTLNKANNLSFSLKRGENNFHE